MSDTTAVHDQYYEMANAPVNRIIPKLAVPTIISMLVTSISVSYTHLDVYKRQTHNITNHFLIHCIRTT